MFVVREIGEQAEAGSNWGSWLIRLVGCVILGCIHLWLVQLQYAFWTSWSLKFRNRTFLISWLGFLPGFWRTTLAAFQAPHYMKPQRERSNGVGRGRLVGWPFIPLEKYVLHYTYMVTKGFISQPSWFYAMECKVVIRNLAGINKNFK